MNSPSYQFYPSEGFSLRALKETYRDFFKQGLRFWTSKNFDIPRDLSIKVFFVVFLCSQIFSGEMSLFGWLNALLGICFQFGLYLGLLILMKEWLQARGTFNEYFSFFIYAFFLGLPIRLFFVLSHELGNLFQMFFSFWVFYCFYKTFQFHLVRYLILLMLIFGGFFFVMLLQITSRGLF